MYKIVCTCGQDMVFNVYEQEKKGSRAVVNRLKKDAKGGDIKIRIGGGAGVLVATGGAVKRYELTNVPDEVVALLHSKDDYMRMKARGFFSEYKEGDEVVVNNRGTPEDMTRRDQCAQIEDHDHAMGTDDRLNHAGTKAFAGIGNVDRGEEPVAGEIAVLL